MRFGPFPHRDLERIEKALSDSNIVYHVHHDAELLQAQIEEWKQQPPTAQRGRALEPAADFVDIEDADLARVGTTLEAYGILAGVEEPDFEAIDDWYCLECDHHSESPGFCPKHSTALINSAAFHAARDKKSENTRQAAWKWGASAAAVGIAGYLVWRWVS